MYLQIDLTVALRVGPLRLMVPISVRDISFKSTARVTLAPLVEALPCIGGVTLTLMGPPVMHFKLFLFGGIDLMALPGVGSAVDAVTGVGGCRDHDGAGADSCYMVLGAGRSAAECLSAVGCAAPAECAITPAPLHCPGLLKSFHLHAPPPPPPLATPPPPPLPRRWCSSPC